MRLPLALALVGVGLCAGGSSASAQVYIHYGYRSYRPAPPPPVIYPSVRLRVAPVFVPPPVYVPRYYTYTYETQRAYWYYQQGPEAYSYYSGPPRWSLGVHATALTTNQRILDEGVYLGGAGAHLRYRDYRWGVELAADVTGSRLLDGGVRRFSVPVQASGLLYLIPRGRFNLFLLGGVRVVATRLRFDLPNLKTEQTFAEFGLQGGVGAELLLSRWVALTGDVRAYGVFRHDSAEPAAYYADVQQAAMPDRSIGVQVNLGVSLRF